MKTLDSLKKRDLLLEELTTDKKAMMTALELTQREVESMKTKLDDKNELLKIKDELLKSREEKVLYLSAEKSVLHFNGMHAIIQIKELEKQLIEKESIIGRLQAEIKKSQEMIKQQNERIEALNSDVSDIQNRSTTREANLDQVHRVFRAMH